MVRVVCASEDVCSLQVDGEESSGSDAIGSDMWNVLIEILFVLLVMW
jgi:hypothetical protein